MKIIIIIVVILSLTACKPEEGYEDINLMTEVEASLITKDDVIRLHKIPSVILAENRANLSFQLSGRINKVFVKIGESVAKDQPLLSVYNPNIDPALETNFAKLESIKAQILQAKRDVASLRELRKNNSTSKNAFERNETVLKDLIAQEKSINAQIDLALANKSESIIKAPFDGVVTVLLKQVGEYVVAGQVVTTVYQQDKQELEINIPRSLWKDLNLGDILTGDYYGQKIDLQVTELSQTADSRSHLMKVILSLLNPIKHTIGQELTVDFPQKFKNIYKLPLEVVVDDGINDPYLFIIVADRAVKQHILPLFISGGNIIFKSESDIKDRVVIKGQSKISQGMLLQVIQ